MTASPLGPLPLAPVRVLVTGSRDWTDAAVVRAALLATAPFAFGGPSTVVHGGAEGADLLADRVARQLGMTVEIHRARWRTEGRAAGPLRNQHMVNLGARVCLAFPLGRSPGTRDCMSRAAEAGIPVVNLGDQL